ncbi:MAG: hypothetical protein WCO16_01430 [bacterium]
MQPVIKNKNVSKVCACIISLAILFTSFPVVAFAQYSGTDAQYSGAGADIGSANQAKAYNEGSTSGGNSAGKSIAGGAGTCLASSILSGAVSGVIKSAIGALSNVATTITDKITKVSTSDSTHQDKSEVLKEAQAGFTIPYVNVLIGVSWDGIAWCIANSLIEYVADSTIKWANSGFNGSPSFISNTDNFFENLADQEAGNFINSIAGNVTNGGVNLCSNFKVSISIGLSNYYSRSNYNRTSSCSLSKVVKNIDNFMNGNFNEGGWEGWFSMTQNASNNRIGATILATDELYARISAKNNTAKLELGLNNGFLNYKKCADPKDPKSCKTVTPGTVIQSSLEKSLNLPKDRLVLAQKFDQVIEAVVNNLIKVALNEVLNSK